jgi:hypothetical protein
LPGWASCSRSAALAWAQVAAADDPWTSAEGRQALQEHQRAETEAVDGSGQFEHVAEEGQVPYWQLRATNQAASTPEQALREDAAAEAHTNTADDAADDCAGM